MDAAERGLLDDVLANPDDDEPRSRHAEWLSSKGDRRGQFIHQQLEAAMQGTTSPAPDPAWLAVFAPWSAEDIVFRRGFAEEMSLTGRSFISLGAGLFQTTPLRSVRFVAVQHIFAELMACPLLARLRRIDLWGNQIGPAGVAALAACPHLGGLRELNLSRNGLGDEGALQILSAPWLRQLTHLDVSDNNLTEAVENRLGRCREPSGTQTLQNQHLT